MENNCGFCKFYERSRGECRKRPPVLVVATNRETYSHDMVPLTAWPDVDDYDWCGEFERDIKDNDGAPL